MDMDGNKFLIAITMTSAVKTPQKMDLVLAVVALRIAIWTVIVFWIEIILWPSYG